MTCERPSISVVVPTHNRSASLRRTLDALCVQTYPVQRLEVVVVADGCTDDTAEMLRRYEAPFALRAVEQPGVGAAGARNRGAANAAAPLLLFLDDDVEPTPPVVEAHVRLHQRQAGQVVLGPCLPVVEDARDYHCIKMRAWWHDRFRAMQEPWHRFTYHDLLSGNLSIPAGLYAHVGGFDPALLTGHEDYELGIRLIQADAPIVFAASALAYHHDRPDVDRAFRRARHEGYADVLIGRRHPEMLAVLPLSYYGLPPSRLVRTMRRLAFKRPAIGDARAAALRRRLDRLERAHLRRRWLRLSDQLHDYWYWRGVAGALGSRKSLVRLLQSGPAHADMGWKEIEVNLQEGLQAAETRLDEERPHGVRLWYGRQPIGRIPPQPGAERLRGVHLRPNLVHGFAVPMLKALAFERIQETVKGQVEH